MRGLILVLATATFACAQADNSASPYVLRLEHTSHEGHACVLLQDTGAFHLEVDHGDQTKVSEGTLPANDLHQVERDLQDGVLAKLSQRQIQEPLIRTRRDELQISLNHKGGWQDLFFQSSDSQQPFEHSLRPLIRWLDDLHKLSHRELSEDEGKNRCLPPKKIALKKRDSAAPRTSLPGATLYVHPIAPPASPPQTAGPAPSPLLRVYSFEVKTGNAHESCVLVAENGQYRFEDRTQKAGKLANTEVYGGQIGPRDLIKLHQLLDDPALAKIRHREPRETVLRVMGNMLNLSIMRPTGVQQIVLSSGFGRQFGTVYGGDADISHAHALMKFLSEHFESRKTGALDPSSRNNCAEPEAN